MYVYLNSGVHVVLCQPSFFKESAGSCQNQIKSMQKNIVFHVSNLKFADIMLKLEFSLIFTNKKYYEKSK